MTSSVTRHHLLSPPPRSKPSTVTNSLTRGHLYYHPYHVPFPVTSCISRHIPLSPPQLLSPAMTRHHPLSSFTRHYLHSPPPLSHTAVTASPTLVISSCQFHHHRSPSTVISYIGNHRFFSHHLQSHFPHLTTSSHLF